MRTGDDEEGHIAVNNRIAVIVLDCRRNGMLGVYRIGICGGSQDNAFTDDCRGRGKVKRGKENVVVHGWVLGKHADAGIPIVDEGYEVVKLVIYAGADAGRRGGRIWIGIAIIEAARSKQRPVAIHSIVVTTG